jgi:hypothetical protein
MPRRGTAVLLAVLTALPYLWAAVFSGYLLPKLMTLGQPDGISPEMYFPLFALTWRVTTGVILGVAALGAFYAWHVYRCGRVPPADRTAWAVGLLLLGLVVMPVYWHRYVWGAPAELPN